MTEHHFTMEATWHGGRLGTGELTGKGLSTTISIPAEMGGPGAGTNPEELLISSALNCYTITLAAILEKRDVQVKSLSVQSEGILASEGGSHNFRKIIHRPTMIVSGADAQMVEKLIQFAHRAEQACMISKALRGNVEVSVEPVVQLVQADNQEIV